MNISDNYSAIVFTYFFIGCIWLIAQIPMITDYHSISEYLFYLLSIEKFQKGNIFGKILIIIKNIIFIPFIIPILLILLFLYIGRICIALIKKLCGWNDN